MPRNARSRCCRSYAITSRFEFVLWDELQEMATALGLLGGVDPRVDDACLEQKILGWSSRLRLSHTASNKASRTSEFPTRFGC